jgi:murein DD-endopeptidase MepM/ murein hydrolase activator NlpD
MSVSAQDLIARQAPVDVKLKSVDSLALQKAIKAEQEEFPSLDIYQSWDNEFVNAYANAVIPETYTFDLTGFCMPTPNTKINDVFGYRPRRRRAHYGLDIKVNVGDTIRAAFDGKVRIVKNQGRRGYGKYIVIRHDNGLETVYGHLSKQIVKEDQLVRAGDVIGLGGNTGRSTGSHLHFETRFLGVAINPALMFDFEKQDVTADKYTHVFKKQPAKRTSRSAASTAAADGKGVYYKVKNGDTLSKIASKQGVSVNQLCKLNGITTKTVLRIGQVLRCS